MMGTNQMFNYNRTNLNNLENDKMSSPFSPFTQTNNLNTHDTMKTNTLAFDTNKSFQSNHGADEQSKIRIFFHRRMISTSLIMIYEILRIYQISLFKIMF